MSRNCIIRHNNDPAVLDALRELITGIPDTSNCDSFRVQNGQHVGCGDWSEYEPESRSGVYDGYTMLDATTDMDAVREFFGQSAIMKQTPSQDPGPQPILTPEEEREVCLRFNLSPEQWEPLPPDARKALAGATVTIVNTAHQWRPVSQPPGNSNTVIFTSNRSRARDSAGCVSAGYFSGLEPEPNDRSVTPEWWCELPGPAARDEEDVEGDSPDESE